MIEVNEYVRTKNGIIGIFDRYSSRKENSLYKSPFNCFIKIKNRKTPLQCCEDYIKKHSKQLIDLIENKDILKVRIDKTIMFFGIDESTSDTKYKEIIKSIENGECELLEILTHQQFEANCYKAGGEDEQI